MNQSAENRLLPGTKTFDFYDVDSRTATSAKTLDTSTTSRMTYPSRVRGGLSRYLDDIVGFDELELPDASVLRNADIDRRVIDLAVPRSTTLDQWQQLRRIYEDARLNDIELRFTTTGKQ